MNEQETFVQLYDAGRVQRLHTVPDYTGAARPNLADHQWGVAMLCDYLTDGKPSVALLRAALLHDLTEAWLGDLPAPAKWDWPELASAFSRAEFDLEQRLAISVTLTLEEQLVLKWADALELFLYCVRRNCWPYHKVAANIYEHMSKLSRHERAHALRRYVLLRYGHGLDDLDERMKDGSQRVASGG